MIKRIRSLIKEYFSDELMGNLDKIYRARNEMWVPNEILENTKGNIKLKYKDTDEVKEGYTLIRILNNNDKINLTKLFVTYEWGDNCNWATGTNRCTVIRDGYVFKIAQDNEGCTDNHHEFIMSKRLQPYVTKTYESNKLVLVGEYVRVIRDEAEFNTFRNKIMDTLDELNDITSLMLDVGFIPKNKSNWGIRSTTGKPVILDYGYLYSDLDPMILTCNNQTCNDKHGIAKLGYNNTYSTLRCEKCGKEYTTLELHSLITDEVREDMYNDFLNNDNTHHKVDKPVTYYDIDVFGDATEVHDAVGVENSPQNEIDKLDIEAIETEYCRICSEIEYMELARRNIDSNLYELREHFRRLYLEARYRLSFDELDESIQNWEPYEEIKESPDFCKFTNDEDAKVASAIFNRLTNGMELDPVVARDVYKVCESIDPDLSGLGICLSNKEINDILEDVDLDGDCDGQEDAYDAPLLPNEFTDSDSQEILSQIQGENVERNYEPSPEEDNYNNNLLYGDDDEEYEKASSTLNLNDSSDFDIQSLLNNLMVDRNPDIKIDDNEESSYKIENLLISTVIPNDPRMKGLDTKMYLDIEITDDMVLDVENDVYKIPDVDEIECAYLDGTTLYIDRVIEGYRYEDSHYYPITTDSSVQLNGDDIEDLSEFVAEQPYDTDDLEPQNETEYDLMIDIQNSKYKKNHKNLNEN